MGNRWRIRAALAALVLLTSGSAFAQSIARIEPIVAKQCAVWAAARSVDAEDNGDAEAARTYEGISQYFVGLYEGTSGRGIDAVRDDEALIQVDRNTASFDGVCSGFTQAFGERMGAWGDILSAVGGSTPKK